MTSATTPGTDAAAWAAARRLAETRFGRIAYADRGSGRAALFLHGFPLNGFQWRGLFDRLAAHRRCVAPDLMGLGFTEIPANQGVTPADQVAMLEALLDALAIPIVDVVANDSGGQVAQLFMARHPERVRTLLLTNCDTEPDSPPPAVMPLIRLARAGRFADERLAPWSADKTLARSAQGLFGMTFTYPHRVLDESIDCYLAPLVSSAQRKAQVDAFAVGLYPNPLAGTEAELRKGTTPVRILWGTGDEIFSQDSPDYLDRIFRGSRGVCRVPGARLFWPEEFPDLIAEEACRLWGI